MDPILSIIVPTYNMEMYLRENLDSYLGEADSGLLEVLVMDNSSTDASPTIACSYAEKYPALFTVIRKENKGYGSSVNVGIKIARGKYLRIVDADDWVAADALHLLLNELQECSSDLVETDYTTVHIGTGEMVALSVRPRSAKIGVSYKNLQIAKEKFPTIHSTTFRTEFLRENNIALLENTLYVDEQLMILSYIHARSILYSGLNLYRYRIGNVAQSVSAVNMGRHYRDRERVIISYLEEYLQLEKRNKLRNPCPERILQHIGNHFTTLYMYVVPRKEGRRFAKQWSDYIKRIAPELYKNVGRKRRLLWILNLLHTSIGEYAWIKKLGKG